MRTPLSPPRGTSGPLKVAWTVPDGSEVKKGDVVVRFAPTVADRVAGGPDRHDFDRIRSKRVRLRQRIAHRAGLPKRQPTSPRADADRPDQSKLRI